MRICASLTGPHLEDRHRRVRRSGGGPEREPDAEPGLANRFHGSVVQVRPDEEVCTDDRRLEGLIVPVVYWEGTPLSADKCRTCVVDKHQPIRRGLWGKFKESAECDMWGEEESVEPGRGI